MYPRTETDIFLNKRALLHVDMKQSIPNAHFEDVLTREAILIMTFLF